MQATFVAGILISNATGIQPTSITAGSGRANAIITLSRWEHEEVFDTVQARLDREPERMRARRETVEHPFGTIKSWMDATHFQMRTLERVSIEMSLHVPAYILKRVMQIMGAVPLMEAMRA